MQQSKIFQYFDQNPDLRVLFIFDPAGDILNEVESFTWTPPYEVHRFNGDWFATKCKIADLAKDARLVLLMPMDTPLESQERMARFPLLGELCANAQYADEDYHSFMSYKGIPEAVAMFVRSHLSDLQLQKFDKVLAPHYGPDFSRDMGMRGILTVLLGETGGLRSWQEIFVRLFTLDLEDPETSKKRKSFFSAILLDRRYADVLAALQDALKQTFGAEMEVNKEPHMTSVAMSLRYNSITQELPLLPADNYGKRRITDGVVLTRMNDFLYSAYNMPKAKCDEFLSAYTKLSEQIKEDHIVNVYGVSADYRAYPPGLCRALLTALVQEDVQKTAEAVKARADQISARPEAMEMQSVAAYLSAAASLYFAFGKIKTFKLNTLVEYVTTYVGVWHNLDRCYRISLERYYAIVSDADRQIVETVKRKVDADYGVKVNEMNCAWVACLKANGGSQGIGDFLLQQNFYNSIGDPEVKHAVIISDGLRYEVAKEIEEKVNAGRHKAVLAPGIAMLPSETKFCKPVLLPHMQASFVNCGGLCDIQLDDKFAGNIEERQAIFLYSEPQGACINVSKLDGMTHEGKREFFKQHKLVYIYHDVIDDGSHGKNGKESVEVCRRAVDELVQLINSLHGTYNVNDVLLTTDHGFVLNDILFEDKDKIPVPSSEYAFEKTTRYYLTNSSAEDPGITKFPLKSVSKMNDDVLVAVPTGTARFSAPGGFVYAHGGASLEEMVIPVLRSHLLRPDVRSKVNIKVIDTRLQVLSSQLKVNLLQDAPATATVQSRIVKCGLYANGELVSTQPTVPFDMTDPEPGGRIRKVELTLVKTPGTGLLQFKAFDESDMENPLLHMEVTNCTLVERDF